MQKNKIILSSLIGLFSLNAAASSWMPGKDNALVYAAGGLAVVTGVLAYKICKLSQQIAALDKEQTDLQGEMKNKAEAIDLLGFVTKSQMQSSLNALANREAQAVASGFATKDELKARITEVFTSIRAADTACGSRCADNQQAIHQSTNAAIEVQRQAIVEEVAKALDAHKKLMQRPSKT